jgi:vitamin B12 transporter
MKIKSKLAFLLLFVSSSICSADEPQEVVLSASRVSIPEREVGGSVSIINRQEIEQSKATTLVDLLRGVPGVSISQSGAVGALTQVRLRGSEANHVLVLIDGVEVNDLATGSEFNFAHLSPESIERIEVIRGSQSSIWGSDALAGVINIVTKKGYGLVSIEGNTEIGSHRFTRSSLTSSVGKNKYNYFLHGSYNDTDGVNVSEQGSEKDGYDNISLAFNGEYKFNSSFQIGGNARYINATNEYDDISSVTGRPIDADNNSDVDQYYAASYLKTALFDQHWKHKIGVSITDTKNSNEDGFGERRANGQKIKLDYLTDISFETSYFSNEKHKFLFLLEREDENFRQRGLATLFGDPNQNQSIRNYGYSSEYRLSVWDQLFLAASIRQDVNDGFRDETTYRFSGAYYFPNLGTKLRTAYGTGVKNPTFTELFGFFPSTFIGNENLQPEKSQSWEVGVDQEYYAETVHFGATLFWEKLQDEISNVFFPINTAVNINGKSKRSGVEFYFDANLGGRTVVKGSYTYTDSTRPDSNDGGNQVREIRRPENIANLSLNYQLIPNKAHVNLNVNYVDDQLDNDFSSFPAQEVKINDYMLVDVNLSYNISDSINAYVRASNLLDDNYQDVYGFETLGQAIYAGINVNL